MPLLTVLAVYAVPVVLALAVLAVVLYGRLSTLRNLKESTGA